MGRGIVPLALIQNESCRRVTFKKRKIGLIKKVQELTLLCDVEACIVISSSQLQSQSQSQSHSQSQLESGVDVWPDFDKVVKVIKRYKDLPQEEKEKQKMDNLSFIQRQNEKLEKELKEIWMQNKRLEMENVYPSWDPRFDNYTVQQLEQLTSLINSKMEEDFDSIQSHKNNIQSLTQPEFKLHDFDDLISPSALAEAVSTTFSAKELEMDNYMANGAVDNFMDNALVDNAFNPDFALENRHFDGQSPHFIANSTFGTPQSSSFYFNYHESQALSTKCDFDDSPWLQMYPSAD